MAHQIRSRIVTRKSTTPRYQQPENDSMSDSDKDPNVEGAQVRPPPRAGLRTRASMVDVHDSRPMERAAEIPLQQINLEKKRPREIFDCVLIPTSRALKRVKKENDRELVDTRHGTVEPSTIEDDFEKTIKKWQNSKVKKKKNNPVLLAETIRSRINPIGFDIQDQYFTIDQFTREVMVTRAFMSNVYGGSSQQAFPKPSAKKIAEHGLNDFMYLNTSFQPQAPEVPGAPGLWFNPNQNGDLGRFRVFTKINTVAPNNKWLYVGQYDVKLANPYYFSMQEWRAQPAALQSLWADAIANQGWGDWVCARILGRKLYGREATDDECQNLVDTRQYKVVTTDEVNAAYYSGKELMVIWTMKCVGYDNNFQTELSQRYPEWFPPPPKTGTKKKQRL